MQIVYTAEAVFPVLSSLLRDIDFLDESYLGDPRKNPILDSDDDSSVTARDFTEVDKESEIPAYAIFDEARYDFEERLLKGYKAQFEVLVLPILKDKALRDAFQAHCLNLGIEVACYLKKNRKTVLSLAPTPSTPE